MEYRQLTDAEVLAQLPAAEARARRSLRTKPHAKSARYSRVRRTVRIDLTNGTSFSMPVSIIPGLATATEAELADVTVGPFGIAISWGRLDVDVTVAALAKLVFGARTLLQAAGAAGGSSRSKPKAEAARANGKKGGRPRVLRPVPHSGASGTSSRLPGAPSHE